MARLFAACLALALAAVVCADPARKQLGGPPSEFASHVLPTPAAAGVLENSAILTGTLEKKAGVVGLGAQFDLPVDSIELWAFSVYSESALSELTVTLTNPAGLNVDLSRHLVPSSYPLSDDGSVSIASNVYVFEAPIIVGTYKLSVSCTTCTSASDAVAIHLFNNNQITVFSHLQSYENSFVGQPIGLVSRITAERNFSRGAAPSAMVGVVQEAFMDVTLPDGKKIDVPMHDDGLHGDLAANDGVWGATITATEPGDYVAAANLYGKVNGVAFLRTTEQIISVLEPDLSLTGTATAVADSQQRLTINIGVSKSTSNKYRGYAEVWGVDNNGAAVAIAWISAVVNTVASVGSIVLPLELDLQWVAKAGAKAPYTLKNVVVQDMTTFMPISLAAEIPVTTTGDLSAMSQTIAVLSKKANIATEITEEMRWGVMPKRFAAARAAAAAKNSSDPSSVPIVLSHGYCSSVNPWSKYSSTFVNGHYFLNPAANVPHDSFALLIAAFAEGLGFDSFSAAGHSQGGPVLTHIHNYYWTGLSTPTQGRRIQSVGAPYSGCTGAGSAANLIKIFGMGCGANTDLTVDGSNLWLAGISAEATKDVYYYTSTYKRNQLFGDYCNLAVNLILQWPNDGTSELAYTNLPGATNLGNTEQECHTTGMKYSAQVDNAARNVIINANRAF